ncbi:Alginate lyase 2 [Dillenia turbinata]|uniref:Alginate lyase 2 n=1 Tax=Dillenia turbinata TaxID=194707 RepID=A0AAN8Z365_9MAGN
MKPFISLLASLPLIAVVLHLNHRYVASEPLDPTVGFVSLPLNRSFYHIQKPYDVPEDERYSFVNGIRRFWVYSTDKPHFPTSQTKPRTEFAIQGYNYSSGVWQFEGYGYVPNGTSGVCIMQVFGATPPRATTLMLRVYNGSLSYYRTPVLVPNIYDKWFRLNVIHDVDAAKVEVYIDGDLKFEAGGHGGTSHSLKCGVYAQDDDSYYMESRWRDIKVLRKVTDF